MSYQLTQTGVQVQNILDRVSLYPTLKDSFTVSSLPITRSKTGMTANHELVEAVLGTPSAQLSDWTITTAAGSYTLAGTLSGSTTITLKFAYFA